MEKQYVIILYGNPEYHKEILDTLGLVKDHDEFRKYVKNVFIPANKKVIALKELQNEHGADTLSYELSGLNCTSELVEIVCKPIEFVKL